MAQGLAIDYRIVIAGVPMRWQTVIEDWTPRERFVDSQHCGPYASWFHEHTFRAHGQCTIMEDRVWYALPAGLLGRMVQAVKVSGMLRRIFEYRAARIALRFGVAAESKA